MKKCELLSPAGNIEMLKYAVQYGADAVYLAYKKFGARKFANNFDRDELLYAVNYAHLYNVKVYVTLNTLIYEDEIDDFIKTVRFIHEIGVDAVLVQDFGMMTLIRKVTPNLTIHASTQFHTGNKNTVELLHKYGIKRVVIDREMSLTDLDDLPDDVEIEVFIHGALCVSYSGQCLFSSLVLDRSGNRGECAGLCRLPYRIKDNGKIDAHAAYHLSLKDLCGVDSLYELLKRGISSLKIEGRMKSPQYVGYITKIYRSLIDSFYEGEKKNLSIEEMDNIKILFNRELTKGFLGKEDNARIVNLQSPNHIGLHLGTYRPLKDKIELSLDRDLHQSDTIRFKADEKGAVVNYLYDRKGNLINLAKKGSVAYIDNFLGIKNKGELRLVASKLLNDKIDGLPTRKVPISMEFQAGLNKPLSLTVKEGLHSVTIKGSIPEKAQSRPIAEEDVKRQLSKVGSTVYEIKELSIKISEDLFINLKELNELRREALSALDKVRTTAPKITINDFEKKTFENNYNIPKIMVKVSTEEQYKVASKYATLIFSSDKSLIKRYPNILPKYVDSRAQITNSTYLISDYGFLVKTKPNDIVFTDYMMNITNSITIASLIEENIKGICLSVELQDEKIDIMHRYADMSKVGIMVYGKVELMKMKYNPLNERGTHLVDRNDCEYLIRSDDYYHYLMSSKPINRLESLNDYCKWGVGFIRFDFIDESMHECKKILEKAHTIIHQE